ncbi:MAG: AAA family ATPase, partial [Lachnospiraceae bacterium]|nr:AAA family ATPase [Lachnospiraceae bacterium]
MDFKSICTRSDYVDISGDIFALTENRRWVSLAMPAGSGKTTLLSMLYYFFDVDEDSYAFFKDAKVAHIWNDWQLYLNHRPVLFLDFSDFHSTNMPSALDYIREKMLGLYKEKLHLVMNDYEDREIEIFMRYLTSLEQYDPIGEESLCGHGTTEDGEPHQKSEEM